MRQKYTPNGTGSATGVADVWEEVLWVGGTPPVAREPEYNTGFFLRKQQYDINKLRKQLLIRDAQICIFYFY